jgi:two-component system copper resistance phosphate regulon response regulator CusR/two-component system response regulator QseB
MKKALKILLVEDDQFIGEWLKQKIESQNKVSACSWSATLNDAMNEIERNQYDALVIDLKLPDGNGMDILHRYRQRSAKPNLLVFSVNVALKEKCLRLGAHRFFDKTTDTDKLIGYINGLQNE